MSAWGAIVDKAFYGNKRIAVGRPHVMVVANAASNVPDPCPVGTLIWDPATDNAYICTVANTTLVKINA